MELNTLSPAPGSRSTPRRVGRGIGSGLGKTCGRGHKGSYARAGKGKIKPGFEGGQMPLQRRLPKVGFRSAMARDLEELPLFRLDAFAGQTVDVGFLRQHKVVPSTAKRVKVMLRGEIKSAVHLKGILVSAAAKQAIIDAGGSVE
jgi:large subunit ribosomal protein L15